MSLEALTEVRIRNELKKRDLNTKQELAKSMNIELKELDPKVRRDLILKGDEDCYKKSKEANNGFKHGYLGFDKINKVAKDNRHKMAEYIRKEIFDLLELDENIYNILTNDPFDKPMGNWALIKHIRGKLIGDNHDLAAKNNMYPFLKWKPTINKCEVTEEGKINIQVTDSFTAELGEGIEFQPISHETWKPS